MLQLGQMSSASSWSLDKTRSEQVQPQVLTPLKLTSDFSHNPLLTALVDTVFTSRRTFPPRQQLSNRSMHGTVERTVLTLMRQAESRSLHLWHPTMDSLTLNSAES